MKKMLAAMLLVSLLFAAGCAKTAENPEEPAVDVTVATAAATAPVAEETVINPPQQTEAVTPEAIEMLGQWELAWTEMEGDRSEAESGAAYISVFLNDQSGMRITLDNRDYPEESFTDKELAAFEGEMFPGCGNDQWTAYVGYMGPWDTIYAVTLTEDGMLLLLEAYWEMDGAPMVSHSWYRRVNG